MVLTNSIVWANYDANGLSQIEPVLKSVVTYSDIQEWCDPGPYCPDTNINANPQFVSDTLHLSQDSLCINSGNNDALPSDTNDLDGDGDTDEPIPIDADGNPRIVGASVDMGAYEYQEEIPDAGIDSGSSSM